jgi:parallel beta-helix repeat protein
LHGPIQILSDADFETQGWLGSGTEEDPYVIPSYRFEDPNALFIANIFTSYFEVRNCQFVIDDPEHNAESVGIHDVHMPFLVQGNLFDGGALFIAAPAEGQVIGCIFQNSDIGIDGSNSDHITYRVNTFTNCGTGLLLYDGDSSTNVARQNNFYNCERAAFVRAGYFHHNTIVNCGIGVEGGYQGTAIISDNAIEGCTLAYNHVNNFNEFSRNNISNCERGVFIDLVTSPGASILNNTIDCTDLYAMVIERSDELIITGNNFTRGGIVLDQVSAVVNDNTIELNRVNGKQILYLRDAVDLTISDELGQIILGNANNVRVTGCNIESVAIGIQIMSSYECQVDNCTVVDSDVGVHLYYSPECAISDCNFTMCGVVIDGYTSQFDHNFVNSKPLGFFNDIWSSTVLDPDDFGQIILNNCTDFEINDGTLHNASMGLGIFDCQEIVVTTVTLADNSIYGMNLQIVGYSNFSLIEISGSSTGIRMQNGYRNIIRNNTILSADEGIVLGAINNYNSIFYNIIGQCSIMSARSASAYNYWDDGISLGNWWKDWDGVHVYEIFYDGHEYNPGYLVVDRFPNGTKVDTTIPIITGPSSIIFDYGATGVHLIWDVDDNYPDGFEIYQNGFIISDGDFQQFDTPIVYLDHLDTGTYNFTILVWDFGLNYLTHYVNVTVVNPSITTTTSLPPPTTTTTTITSTTTGTGYIPPNPWLPNPLTLAISIGSIGVIVVMAILSRRALKKKNEGG